MGGTLPVFVDIVLMIAVTVAAPVTQILNESKYFGLMQVLKN